MQENKHHSGWERELLEGKLSSDEVMEKLGKTGETMALIKAIEQTALFKPPEKRSKEEIWSVLVDKVNQEKQTKVIPLYSRRVWIGVAASIVLLIGAFFLFNYDDTVIHETNFGQTASFHLPDNSVVTLNAGSTLSYSKRNWKNERSLSLQGEAFFKVQKGSNFEVNTRLGKVEVLGTSFNVRAYNDILVVACKTGKVRVSGPLNSKQIITPGLKVKALQNTALEAPIEIDTESIDTWIDGEIEIQSWALQEVFEEIERQFNVKVEVEGINPSESVYSGYLDRSNLEASLDELMISYKLQYEIKGKDRVIITGRE
jgi:transmembrane sensor